MLHHEWSMNSSLNARGTTPCEVNGGSVSLAGRAADWKVVTWLILPVVICLSQRLSHACLSINKFVL
jgi:hypothetical protein